MRLVFKLVLKFKDYWADNREDGQMKENTDRWRVGEREEGWTEH